MERFQKRYCRGQRRRPAAADTSLFLMMIISGITELYHELGTFRTQIDSYSSRCHRRWECGFNM